MGDVCLMLVLTLRYICNDPSDKGQCNGQLGRLRMCARTSTPASRYDMDVKCSKIKWKASGRFEVAYPTRISRHQIYNPRTYFDSWNLFMLALYNHFL
jgi:hypothetical protein